MPILSQNVPYTYDQGRDFLKAAEIISNRRPVFIGPTTGIDGLFHGAWWYYVLTIPSLIFNGNPIYFYWMMLLITTITTLLFFIFIKKKFNYLTAIFFLTIVSISPYFVPLAFFASNNIIVPNFIVALIISLFNLFEKNKHRYIMLFIGLSLGFILEFEVSFGLFIIPVFIISVLLTKNLRGHFLKLKNLALFLFGLLFTMSPRILFELKNNFLQTRTIINFFIKPRLHNPKPFINVLGDRLELFLLYFEGKNGIFPTFNIFLALTTIILIIGTLVLLNKKNKYSKTTKFFSLLIILLFIISLGYKDNFWFNYYEGIQYLFLTLIITAFYLLTKKQRLLTLCLTILFIILNLITFKNAIFNTKLKNINGLIETKKGVEYLLSKANRESFCLKIYTPPVIPHTYLYLFNYYSKKTGPINFHGEFDDNKCWYIIENDENKERLNTWLKDKIPANGQLIERKIINNNLRIELWSDLPVLNPNLP